MSTLTSLAPTTATPGSLLTLTGTGFLAGAIALFNADGQAGQANAVLISSTQVLCLIPGLPDGDYLVSVANLAEAPSNAVALILGPTVAPGLCTLDDLKTLLSLSPEEKATDRQLEMCIRMATGEIIGFCGHAFDVRSYTERYDGDGTNVLMLKNTPTVGLQALTIDGLSIDVAEAKLYSAWLKFDDSDDYNARLRSGGRIFARGAQNIEVTYTAGYSEVPDDIAMACARQAMYIQNTIAKQGLSTENNQSSAASKNYVLDKQLAPAVKAVALRYRRQTVAIV